MSLLRQRIAGLSEGVTIALDSIRANKVRAGLTILGIAVGVFVVVVISGAVHGINASVAKDLESTGPTTFFVSRFPISFEACDGTEETCKFFRNPKLTLDDVATLERMPSVRTAGGRLDTQRQINYKDRRVTGVSVSGFTGNWQQIDGGGDIFPGRNFTNNEAVSGERVVVINDELATQLFGESDPLDKTIELGDQPFKVLGVYHYQASFLSGGNKPRAIIPIEAARKHLKTSWADIGIAIIPATGTTRATAIDDVIAVMRARHALRPGAENDFAIITQDQLFEVYNKIFGAFFLVMIVLSAVGLIVGGVGVIAIMMISVTERTREIGVRKALGATKGTILWQFLVEAVTLTGIGAIIGLVFGTLVTFLIKATTPVAASVPPIAVVAALLTSCVTGVLFGMLPAAKAAKLDPVVALRYE
ncbi:MAG TPA: ABC transporter permease [Gemmatimonadaceae bacterium]|jgi:putative ABC transport system permease protein|nr:ABC transporter permease [Gemmatimonadaceae bacterium]